MKAILSQFTGGGPTRGDIMSAAGPGSQEVKADSASSDASSFMGMMKGFLGMNEKPAAAANSEGAISSETNNEGKKSADGSSTTELSGELSGKRNAGAAALMKGNKTDNGAAPSGIQDEAAEKSNAKAGTIKSADGDGEEKNKAIPMSTEEKLSSRPTKQTLKNSTVSEAASSDKAAGADGEESRIKTTDSKSGKETADVPAETKKGNADGNMNLPEAVPGKDPQQMKTKTKAATPDEVKIKGEKTGTAARWGGPEKDAVQSRNIQPAAGGTRGDRVPAPEIDTSSTSGKEQAASRQRKISGMQASNMMKQSAGQNSEIVNEGGKNPAIAADVLKKAQQQEAKSFKTKAEKGRAPEASARRPAAQASPSAPALGQSSRAFIHKADVNIPGMKNFTPGKFISSEVHGQLELETDPAHTKEAGPLQEKSFKEIHLNEFKSTRLTEMSGRKKFSKYLGDVGRQQAAGRSDETARQATQWKHHRFVMKDGKTLNISARSADGALQLQLNAGSGELGKVLQRHLQDIRQHVQQELNIKVDLQLQDFSGGQSEQQQEARASQTQRQMRGVPNSGESGGTAVSGTSSGTERVRYLGFNNNEWTA